MRSAIETSAGSAPSAAAFKSFATTRQVALSRKCAGKCRSISSRTSASVTSVMTSGMTSGRGNGRDQFGPGSGQLLRDADFTGREIFFVASLATSTLILQITCDPQTVPAFPTIRLMRAAPASARGPAAATSSIAVLSFARSSALMLSSSSAKSFAADSFSIVQGYGFPHVEAKSRHRKRPSYGGNTRRDIVTADFSTAVRHTSTRLLLHISSKILRPDNLLCQP